MQHRFEGDATDASLGRLIGLLPCEPRVSQKLDLEEARSLLRRRLSRKFPRAVYESDDFLQECLLRAVGAMQTPHKWKGDGPLRAWFFKIARNLLVDILKRDALITYVYYDEETSALAEEMTLGAAPADYSRRFAEFRDWIRCCGGDAQLLEFLDALIEYERRGGGRCKMQFVMNRLGLDKKSGYNTLQSRLRRVSSRYVSRGDSVLHV
jgi:hypothetical protein